MTDTTLIADALVQRGVPIALRDGTVLLADVWRPALPTPVPVLLQRTPYDRRDSLVGVHHAGLEPLRAVDAGWAVVVQDVRGRFGSEGAFDPFEQEAADGADTVAWLCEQPWCDGRVCPYGTSYPGAASLLAAASGGVAAFAATETGAAPDGSWFRRDGAAELGFALGWATADLAGAELAELNADDAPAGRRAHAQLDPADAAADLAARLRHPAALFAGADAVGAGCPDDPGTRGADGLGADGASRPGAVRRDGLDTVAELVPALRGWLEDPAAGRFWAGARMADIAVPGLHVGGWHDVFLRGTLATYGGLRDGAATPAARAAQRLVVGPWSHGHTGSRIGARDFGPDSAQAALDLTRVQLEFLTAALAERLDDVPAVRLFLMGADRWTTETAWPPRRTRTARLHLRAGGRLDFAAPGDEPADAFDHDPADPVPTTGGATTLPPALGLAGPADQAVVATRPDVRVYTSDPLPGPVELIGPVTASLWAASSAGASDWVVTLVEVDPDGRALNVCDGIRRVADAEPDAPACHHVDLGATALRVPAGHRLRVQVASTDFPRFDRCPTRPARQRVFHDAARPSALDLPLATGALAA